MTSGDELMRHWPVLLSYVRRRLPDADLTTCEDIAADAIAKALTRYRDLGVPDGLRRWLLTAARNAAIDWRRVKARTEVPLLYLEVAHGRTDAGNDRHADLLDVRAAVAALKPLHRGEIERYRDGYDAQKSRRWRAVVALRGAYVGVAS
jgi:DNA-directed RNA polymerase specialized sigma24 family protein